MKISKCNRNIIIKLAENELDKKHKSKESNRKLRSIISKMKDSLADTKSNNQLNNER